MANHLSLEKKSLVLSCLVEGSSIRSIERITGVHRDAIMRIHRTLDVTPAMEAGVWTTIWTSQEFLENEEMKMAT